MRKRKFVVAMLGSLLLLMTNVSEARGSHSSGHSSSRSSGGSHSVRAHVTRSGKYVSSHRATNRDGSRRNNWSTRGNVNPYTGKAGTKRP